MTDRSGGPAGEAESEPRIEVGLATDVGQVRTGNEDSVLCEPLESVLVAERGLFCAVADGMGGHAAGEDASSMAVQVARDVFYATNDLDSKEALRLAVVQANTITLVEVAGGQVRTFNVNEPAARAALPRVKPGDFLTIIEKQLLVAAVVPRR